MKLRILLADDHDMLRKALRLTLEMEPDIEVVAEARDGYDVLQGVRELSPDVVCIDISMPGLNGIEATRQLLAIQPQVKVIALSCHTDPSQVAEMFNAGAHGYVLKMGASDELLPAIRMVSQNQTYLSPEFNGLEIAELAKYATPARAD